MISSSLELIRGRHREGADLFKVTEPLGCTQSGCVIWDQASGYHQPTPSGSFGPHSEAVSLCGADEPARGEASLPGDKGAALASLSLSITPVINLLCEAQLGTGLRTWWFTAMFSQA